jgi:hypothetical protein
MPLPNSTRHVASFFEPGEGLRTRRSGFRFSGNAWARQDFPSALRGLDSPGALPGISNYRSDGSSFRRVSADSAMRNACGALAPSRGEGAEIPRQPLKLPLTSLSKNSSVFPMHVGVDRGDRRKSTFQGGSLHDHRND